MTRVFNGNYRFNVFKDADCVYTGNSTFIAFLYRMLEKCNNKYYVGDSSWRKK